MANKKANCKIERGYSFGNIKNGTGWQVLSDGYGVVVVESSGGIFVSQSKAFNFVTEEDDLRKLFAGARTLHAGKAFLVKRKNGCLAWLGGDLK